MPSSNQIVIEVKCNLIRNYGHVKGYSWAGKYTVDLALCNMEFLWYLFNCPFVVYIEALPTV
jgi:hypothetical protein